MNKVCILLIYSVSLFISSCGERNTKITSDSGSKATIDSKLERPVAPTGEIVEVVVKSDDRMRFDVTEIRVNEGQTIKLTLQHIGTMPKSAMGHNFVLLEKGVDLSTFGNAIAKAKAPNYDIPDELMSNVIVHTRMISGGESDTVEFITPSKGAYQFLCSFPAHYGIMKGVFIVE